MHAGANRGLGLEICRQLSAGGSYSSIFAICRKTSEELSSLAAAGFGGEKIITIVENVEITKDDATSALQKLFATKEATPVPIHLLVHNAGGYGAPEYKGVYSTQNLQNITADNMRFAFELNTLAPLMVTKALLPNLIAAASDDKENSSKVIIISSAMGSIAENESGGHYGYRVAKAGVNIMGKSLAVDLKDKNIAVGLGTIVKRRHYFTLVSEREL
jgi:NAD(P)-dependent dehydrogenase (short-subunit alcohol dehydrogenase family)